MKVRKINENTLSCIISPEDLRENGIQIDDFFDRKKDAIDFIRSAVVRAARSENFNLEGEFTTMRVSVLPDHSLSLLITREDTADGMVREARKIAKSIFESIAARAAEASENKEAGPEDLIGELLSDSFHQDAARQEESGGDSPDQESSGTGDNEQRDQGSRRKSFMFSFYSVRDAMDCCRVFANAGPFESSFYYLKEDEIYFLILQCTEKTPDVFDRRVLSANEFGELVTANEQYISYVKEHGICIAKGSAVQMFMDVLPGNMIPKMRTEGKPTSPDSHSGTEGDDSTGISGNKETP